MSIVIAHISDLHHPHCKNETWQSLTEYLKRKKPLLIVVTGDLTDHPWLWRQLQVKRKLVALAEVCKDGTASAQLLIIPGNHDYAFWGNFNFDCGIIFRSCFNWTFREYKTDFYEVSNGELRILFFCFDSNPYFARFAKGVVSKRQLRNFQRTVDELKRQDRAGFEGAFKVAVLHHHPLPIPYSEAAESFLVLKNAGEFIRFAAQAGINLLLHGHKHNAVISSINLGTVLSGKRKIAVVASGSTLRRSDSENSMNLITFRTGLPTTVTQVSAAPGCDFIENNPVNVPAWNEYIEDQYLTLKNRLGYEIKKFARSIIIDDEGDGYTRLRITNFCTHQQHFSGIEPFEISVRAGSIEGFQIDAAPHIKQLMKVERIPEERTQRIKVHISAEISKHSPVNFGFQYWTLNAWALSAEEYSRKYAKLDHVEKIDPPHENVFLESSRPVDQFNFEIQLPSNCKLIDSPELQIKESNSDQLEIELQNSLSRTLNFSNGKNVIFLHVEKPLYGFKYDIRWHLPAHSAEPNIRYAGEIAKAIQRLIEIAKDEPKKVSTIMSKFEDILRRTFNDDKTLNLNIQPVEEIDVTFSVPVYKAGQPASLQVIAANLDIADIKNFCLAIGDGTGGRAFKTNRTQSYLEGRVDSSDPKKNLYVRFGEYIHKVLYSSPIRHPLSKELLLGVLSVGSRDTSSALIPAKLEQIDEISAKVFELAQSFALGVVNPACGGVLSTIEIDKG